MIDTHTHLNFAAFDNDWREVVKRAKDSGIEKMIVVGTDLVTSKKAIDMAEEVDSLYAAAGIHPHHAKSILGLASEMQSQVLKLEEFIKHPKVVAVGEIGIDFHEYGDSKVYDDVAVTDELIGVQKELFRSQIKLALKHNKPVIVHSREAGDSVLEELGTNTGMRGVFHCFEGSKKYAKRILEAGYFVSFTGNITYDFGRAETSKIIPMDRLLLETDCPYMTPSPLRDNKNIEGKIWRNEPSNVKITAKYHAKLRDTPFEDVGRATTSNASKLFGI